MTNPPQRQRFRSCSPREEKVGRHVGYLCAGQFGALPPIEFDCDRIPAFARCRALPRPVATQGDQRVCILTQCRQIHVVVMIVRYQEQVHVGNASKLCPGRRTRRGPATETGLHRSDQIGSVRTQTPLICNRNVEWPIKVAAIRRARCGQAAGRSRPQRASGHGSFWRVRCQRWTARRLLPLGTCGLKNRRPSK